MRANRILLGTTAIVGVGLMQAAAPGVAGAAEVLPGGALDVTMSGFIRFRAHGGDLDNQRLNPDLSTGLDFSNDTEVHVIVRGKHEPSGSEYGGTVEFEADTNRTDNTDESWLFVRGGWGEARFGDEDGVVDNSSLGGYTIAAGTGGIDGSVVDAIAIGVIKSTNTSDATKIRYYTPSFGGLQLAVSYTPNQAEVDSGGLNGDLLAPADVEAGDIVEGGVIYRGDVAGLGVQASVVGSFGDVKNESGADDDGDGDIDGLDGDDYWTLYGGAATEIFGFKLGGGIGTEEIGGLEKDFYNVGLGLGIGPANVSVTHGMVLDSDGYTADQPYNIILSADVALLPGLVLAGDVGYFNNDIGSDDLDEEGVSDDDGFVGVARLGVAF